MRHAGPSPAPLEDDTLGRGFADGPAHEPVAVVRPVLCGRSGGDEYPYPAAAFEALYRANEDPWQLLTSAYERFRYLVTLRALSRARYSHAFEPGCSVGELTQMLAQRCARVWATDLAPTAIQVARRRCAALPHVRFDCADLAAGTAEGPFDLIVFSEIGYYFRASDLRAVAQQLASKLSAGGELIAVHWLGQSPDHALHGDDVHRVLAQTLPLRWTHGERHRDFRLDRWLAPMGT